MEEIMKKQYRIPMMLLIVVLSLTVFMAGCSGSGDSETPSDSNTPSDSGTTSDDSSSDNGSGEKAHPELNLRINTDVQTMDIHMTNSPYDYYTSTQVFEGFVRFPDGGGIQSEAEPALASEWSFNEAGDELTFILREGVTFHDGSPFTVDDAVYTVDRWQATPFVQTKVSMIDHAEKIDDKSFKIVLTDPYPQFITLMCGWPYRVVQKAACEKNGIDQALSDDGIIGTGPYKFEKNVIGEGVTLVANKDWWDGEPYFEKINYKLIADETTAMTALLNGEIDLNQLMTGLDVKDVESDEDLQVIKKQLASTYIVNFNLTQPPFNNDKVREAINYGIKRDVYVDLVWDGLAIGDCRQALSPDEEGYLGENLPAFTYDVEKAKQLIKESGLSAADLKFDLKVPTSYNGLAFGATFKEDMAAIGIDVNVVELELGAHTAALYAFDYQAYYWNQGNIPYCSPYEHAIYYRSDGAINTWVELQPEIDAMVDEARLEMDDAKRVKLYEDIEVYIRDKNLWAPIAYRELDFGAAKQLKNTGFESGTIAYNVGLWTWEE
jgi:ABC-type transport system substrate-binding protein